MSIHPLFHAVPATEQKEQKPQKRTRDFPFCLPQSAGRKAEAGNRELPFMTETPVRINSSKLLEAMVISVATTLMIFLFAIPRIEEKISALSKEVEGVKTEVREIRSDIYVPAHRAREVAETTETKR